MSHKCFNNIKEINSFSPSIINTKSFLTIIISGIRLEGAEGLYFRVAAFITSWKTGHFFSVINPFTFIDSKDKAKWYSLGMHIYLFTPWTDLNPAFYCLNQSKIISFKQRTWPICQEGSWWRYLDFCSVWSPKSFSSGWEHCNQGRNICIQYCLFRWDIVSKSIKMMTRNVV